MYKFFYQNIAFLFICICVTEIAIAQTQKNSANPCKTLFRFEFPKSFTEGLPSGVCEEKIGKNRYFNSVTDLFYPKKKRLQKGLFYLAKEQNKWVLHCYYHSTKFHQIVQWSNVLTLRYYDGENAILVCEPNTIFFLNKKDRYCRAFNPIQLARSNSVIFNVFYLLDTKLYPFASAKCTTQRIEINRYDYTKDVLYISLLENSFNKKEGALGQKDFNTLQNILLDKNTKVVKTTRSAPVDEPTLYKDVPIWTF